MSFVVLGAVVVELRVVEVHLGLIGQPRGVHSKSKQKTTSCARISFLFFLAAPYTVYACCHYGSSMYLSSRIVYFFDFLCEMFSGRDEVRRESAGGLRPARGPVRNAALFVTILFGSIERAREYESISSTLLSLLREVRANGFTFILFVVCI